MKIVSIMNYRAFSINLYFNCDVKIFFYLRCIFITMSPRRKQVTMVKAVPQLITVA